jgi:replicative DNA helicase
LRELAAAGFADEDDDEYRDAVAAGVLKLLSVPRENRMVPLRTVIREAIATVEKRFESKSTVTGIATGYPELDGMLAGLQPGELVILAGRPSMGKSALAFNVAINAALFASASVLVHSLEMSRGSVGERVLSSDSPVDGMRLRSGRLQTHDWVALTKSAGRLAALPVTIDDSGTLTIADIRARARRWAATTTGRRLVVVDYLQLVSGERVKGGNREQEISSISRGLKQLAKELECPVLALSQLSRALESRSDKRPIMSDLRESGAIEQDADVIAFVYRDEVYNPDSDDKGVAEVIVGKQRNGPIGTVRLHWQSQFSRFDSRAGVTG